MERNLVHRPVSAIPGQPKGSRSQKIPGRETKWYRGIAALTISSNGGAIGDSSSLGTFGVCRAIDAGGIWVSSMSIFAGLTSDAALSAANELGFWCALVGAVMDG
jgi:hypothetical protein